MGFIGNTLGSLFGNSSGTGFQAQSAPLQDPTAIAQQQAFVNALAAQNGIGNQSSVFNQLQGVASGQGPNPAQAMLAQATGQNVANQAALMAGQRGAGANTGLIARQSAQQGAGIQQNAAAQGATLQAQQSLGALGQLGGIAGQQVGQQQAGNQLLGQLQLGYQSQQLQNTQQQNSANAGIANTNAEAQQGRTNGLLNGIGQAGALAGGSSSSAAKGAAVFAHGGAVEPKSAFGRHLAGLPPMMASGGQVPAMVSPGERYLPPAEVAKVAQGQKSAASAGEKIPGDAKVKGDSLKNDTVPATLEEGGIVIPRSILQSKNPSAAAAKFVMDTLKKSKK